MTYKGIIAVICLCLGFISCSENEVIKFADYKSLEGHPVEEISVFSRGNVYLNVVDTFLIVSTSSDEPFLSVYSTNTHQLIKQFGKEGKGPREFLSFNPLRQTSVDSVNKSPVLHVHDFKSNRMGSIRLFRLLEGAEDFSMGTLPANNRFFPFLHYMDEELLIATPEFGGNLFIQHLGSKQNFNVPFLPKPGFEISEQLLYTVYRPTVVVNKKKKLIAVAPLYLGEIDFYDLEGNYIKSSVFEARSTYKNELSKGIGSFENIKYQIAELDVSGDYIYGLNFNTAVKDYNSGTWNSKIQVFNWDGEPIIEYMLDGRPVRSFAYDAIHNKFYAYDPNEEQHNVVVYEL